MSYRQPFNLLLESNAGRLEVLLQEHLRLKHRVGENGAQEGFICLRKKMPKKTPNESNESLFPLFNVCGSSKTQIPRSSYDCYLLLKATNDGG